MRKNGTWLYLRAFGYTEEGMPITKYLPKDGRFGPEAIKAMRAAYAEAITAVGRAQPASIREILAKRIITATEEVGGSDPRCLCDAALRSLGIKRHD